MDSSCNTNAYTICSNQNPSCPGCCCGLSTHPDQGFDTTICCANGVTCSTDRGCQGAVYSDYDTAFCGGNAYCGQKVSYNGYSVTEYICCQPGQICCGGTCCTQDNCKNGYKCCPSSTDIVINNQCCSGTNCGGKCCPIGYSCCAGVCCPSDHDCCHGDICCPKGKCCGGSMCCMQTCQATHGGWQC